MFVAFGKKVRRDYWFFRGCTKKIITYCKISLHGENRESRAKQDDDATPSTFECSIGSCIVL